MFCQSKVPQGTSIIGGLLVIMYCVGLIRQYDQINRLTRETISGGADTQYVYDHAHNRTQKVVSGGTNAGTTTYSYNNLNQLTAANGQFSASYSYDANGNRKTRTVGGVTDNYSYDQENRLVKLIKQTAGGGGIYRYAYDYRTRRVERTEPGSTAKIIFSGGVSVQEYSVGTTDPLVEYVRGSDYGGGVGGILYTLRSGIPSYTHYNSRGDVVAKTNGAGTTTYQAQYEAFGTRTVEQGATQDRQKANTKDEDPTGLLNEGFRYRDLETGVFITRDPLGFVDGPNMYAYVVQNPWTSFDPEGLAKRDEEKTPSNDQIKNRVAEIKGQRAAIKTATESTKDIKELKEWRNELNKTAKQLEKEQKLLTNVLTVRERIGDNGYGEWSTGLEIGKTFGSQSKEIADQFFAPQGGFFASDADRTKLQATARWTENSLNVSSFALGGPIGIANEARAAGAMGSVFWSGRMGANRLAAEAFAKLTGRSTLEMTNAGRALEAAGGNISQWKALSANFAKNASGEVNAFVGGSKLNSVWNTVEKPLLLQNPNVDKIIIRDVINTSKTTIIYP